MFNILAGGLGTSLASMQPEGSTDLARRHTCSERLQNVRSMPSSALPFHEVHQGELGLSATASTIGKNPAHLQHVDKSCCINFQRFCCSASSPRMLKILQLVDKIHADFRLLSDSAPADGPRLT